MAEEAIKLTAVLESPQVVQALQSIVREEQNIAGANRETGKAAREAAREHEAAMATIKSSIMAAGSALGVTFGVGGAISMALNQVKDWREGLRGLAIDMGAAVEQGVALAAIAPAGRAQEALQRTARLAAGYGIAKEPAWAVMRETMGLAGGIEAGLAAAKPIFALAELGVPLEAAQRGVTGLMRAGIAPERAGGLLWAAAEAARVKPEVLAGVGAEAWYFRGARGGPEMAVGIEAALARLTGEDPGQWLPRIRQILTSEQMRRVARRAGFREAFEAQDIPGILAGLQAAGITGPEQLAQIGIERRAMRPLAALLQGDLAATVAAIQIRAAEPDILEAAHRRVEAEVPAEERAHRMAIAKARVAEERLFPPTRAAAITVTEADALRRREEAYGAALVRAGYQPWVGPEGTATWGKLIRAMIWEEFTRVPFEASPAGLLTRVKNLFTENEPLREMGRALEAPAENPQLGKLEEHLSAIRRNQERGAQNYAPEKAR